MAKTEPTFTITNKTLGIRQYPYHDVSKPVAGREAGAITTGIVALLPGPNVDIETSEWAKVESTKAVRRDVDAGLIDPVSNLDITKVPVREFNELVNSAASIEALKSWLGTPGLKREQRENIAKRLKERTRQVA